MEPVGLARSVGMGAVGGAAQSGAAGARLTRTAEEFEAVLLGMLFKSMRATVGSGGLFESGQDSQTYREMFDQELARKVAGAGGIGLAKMILRDQARREAAGEVEAGRLPLQGAGGPGEAGRIVPDGIEE